MEKHLCLFDKSQISTKNQSWKMFWKQTEDRSWQILWLLLGYFVQLDKFPLKCNNCANVEVIAFAYCYI